MLYLESVPAPPLSEFVQTLWYAQAREVRHRRERVLPSGRVQVILNLERDFLTDCREGRGKLLTSPALVVGARSVYEIVDTSDVADLIGVVFQPSGFGIFARDAVDLFSNRSIDLRDTWGASAHSLRQRLRELETPQAKIRCLENFLLSWIAPRLTRHGPWGSAEVAFALRAFDQAPSVLSVRDVARRTGWSERRFSQVFREQVGLTPKTLVPDTALSTGRESTACRNRRALVRAGARVRLLRPIAFCE